MAKLKVDTIPESFGNLHTKKEIQKDVRVTLEDVEYAKDVAIAIRGHFGERLRASGHRDGTNICV